MRSFPADLVIAAEPVAVLNSVTLALEAERPKTAPRIAARRETLSARMRARRAQLSKDSAPGEHISPAYFSRVIGETVGADAIIFNEYPLMLDHCAREQAGTYFATSPAGGLGWGFGAALGAKLAAPDKLIVAALGDGAYLFGNPTVAHWVAQAHALPVLTVIFNNSRYGAVRRATLSMFKDGAAGEDDGRGLAELNPSLAYDALAEIQGAHAERVERPADLPAALVRARDAVLNNQRQALINVICRD
jgi:acetolactate synthase-1/2/3 large subunit